MFTALWKALKRELLIALIVASLLGAGITFGIHTIVKNHFEEAKEKIINAIK